MKKVRYIDVSAMVSFLSLLLLWLTTNLSNCVDVRRECVRADYVKELSWRKRVRRERGKSK